MFTIDEYRHSLASQGRTQGDVRRAQSNVIMEATWFRDPENCLCYLYDYYNDDEPEKNANLSPCDSTTKIPIPAKFIISSYNSDKTDQVPYHLQFMPSQVCNVPYYEEMYHEKYGANWPIGMYVDIPDDKDIYRRWLIFGYANFYARQFPDYLVLPCNYRYSWISDNQKHRVWGASRSQNSYNSGVWMDFKFQTPTNQVKSILPLNPETESMFYDQRLIISAPIREPITWKVTKIESTNPIGIYRVTFSQDRFNPIKDYIERDENGRVVGMWADYYDTTVVPIDPPSPSEASELKITCSAKAEIRVGGSNKTFTAAYPEVATAPTMGGTWTVWIGDEDITTSDLIIVTDLGTDDETKKARIKVKFVGSEDYIGQNLTVKYQNGDDVASKDVAIIAL